jgi:hypothetical protein
VTILGCTIDSNLEGLKDNFDITINKMRNICLFWNRFNLSLPGRICVAKSLLLSQISYLGCFLDPTCEQLSLMKKIIESFIVGTQKISIEKIYLSSSTGGVGMIRLAEFLQAQKCT